MTFQKDAQAQDLKGIKKDKMVGVSVALFDALMAAFYVAISPVFSATKNVCEIDSGVICNSYFSLFVFVVLGVSFFLTAYRKSLGFIRILLAKILLCLLPIAIVLMV